MRRGRFSGALLFLLASAGHAAAQQPGPATFRVLERGTLVGSVSSSLTREDGGWLLTGSSELPGYNLSVRQLVVHYDAMWRPRHMTLQMTSPDDDAIVHVAFGLADGTTRTDIVRKEGAIYGANRVAADTVVLPDLVFSAYEALAARLASLAPGAQLRAFIVPRVEITVIPEDVRAEPVRTRTGDLTAAHWRLRFMRGDGPAPVEVWAANGRLVRLDIPRDGLSVVRDDLLLEGAR